MSIRAAFLTVALVSTSLFTTPAEAIAPIYEKWTEQAVILFGQIAPYGAYAVMRRLSDNSCAFQKIGTTSGLDDDYVFYGNSTGEYFNTLSYTVNLCGYTITPLLFNGHYLDLNPGYGDDFVRAPTASGNSWSYGGPGDDTLYSSSHSSAQAKGGPGDDRIWGGPLTDTEILAGDDGDDIFCIDRTTSTVGASMVSGGAGDDCRIGYATTIASVERVCPSSYYLDICYPQPQ